MKRLRAKELWIMDRIVLHYILKAYSQLLLPLIYLWLRIKLVVNYEGQPFTYISTIQNIQASHHPPNLKYITIVFPIPQCLIT